SRRRHTRFSRDWSSDVCSSDLASSALMNSPVMSISKAFLAATLRDSATAGVEQKSPTLMPETANFAESAAMARSQLATNWQPARSEERRVGKECRSRGERGHET